MSYKVNRNGFLQYFGIKHHEFWSWWWFSIPTWPMWVWYAIRLKKSTWFTAVNPAIEHSGYTEESKMAILNLIPKKYLPLTIFIEYKNDIPYPLLPFPFIAKPDVGGRGRKIEIIKSNQELINYHSTIGENYLIQSIIEHPLELGIFYTKLPSEKKGTIISITEKGFLTVTGNGKNTIKELLLKNVRAKPQIKRLAQKQNLDIIIAENVTHLIEPIGNHCRGTIFLNRNDMINSKVQDVFDEIVNQMPGIYYGRFDLRVSSWDDLQKGENIFVLELNGLTSMDTHIFDPNFRLRDVLPVLLKNCRICYLIASDNIKNNIPTSNLWTILKKTLAFFKE